MTEHSGPVTWTVAVEAGAELGERPVWDEGTGTVVWVDVLSGAVHRSWPTAPGAGPWRDVEVRVGTTVGAVALREGGGLIGAVDSAVRFLGSDGRDDADPIEVALPSGHRFNDGACDPAGRFLIGTAGDQANGVLWSVGADRRPRLLLAGLTESNGIGWSADGTVMYYIDSVDPVVRRYRYDAGTGTLGPRLTDLVDLSSRPGSPDGLVVDRLGQCWVAQWQGGELCCVAPDGQIVGRWNVPTRQPTCPAFAGDQGTRLVLATSRESMIEQERLTDRWAGHLLVWDAAVPGRIADRYRSHGE